MAADTPQDPHGQAGPDPRAEPDAAREPARRGPSVPSVVVHQAALRHVPKASFDPAPPEPDASSSALIRERPGQAPWARIGLGVAICGPALWLGGVPSPVVPVFLGVVLLLWIRLCRRSSERLRLPYASAIGLLAAGLTLLQLVPLPAALREWLAPELVARTTEALAASPATPWPGISPVPGDTALEVARLIGLTGLFVAAAQLSWRVSAALVAGAGGVVALLGLAQAGLGIHAIYGFYRPADVDPSQIPALLTSFVNANHQSGLFLLGIFSAAALAVYYRMQAQGTTTAERFGRARERGLIALAAVAVQGVALVLSLSRGAMMALALVTPLALWLAWRRERRDKPPKHLWLRRLALLTGFGGTAAFLVHNSRAWDELTTLARATEAGFQTKFRIAGEAVALTELSPAVGVGRGAFLDLFPAIDSAPAGVVHTHLESIPVTMLVEWGPLGGAVIGLGLLWWWIAAVYSSGGRHGRPRRIALCGVLALAVHNLADFSLEFLGVAAPLCALAGSLSERRMIVRWSGRAAARVGGLALAAALVLATWALPHTWQARPRGDLSERTADLSPETALRMRPLDGDLHTALAYQAAQAGEWEQARIRARVATRLHPHAADPWWLLTNAEYALGDVEASGQALTHTLEEVREPLPPPVVDTLLARYPNAEELAARMPTALAPWTLVMESIIAASPAYASILAAARSQVDNREPEVLRLQVRIALAMENPALARYHAALLRQLAPEQVSSHLLLVRALRSFRVPREREIQAVLGEALRQARVTDPAELARLEEELITSLVREGSEDSRARARELLPRLQARPGDRDALRRRNELRELLATP